MMSATFLLAQTSEQFQLGRLQDEWQMAVGVAVMALLAAFSVFIYIRDARELHWAVAVLLATLRLSALGMLFFIWLRPEMARFEETTENSQVIVLVDASPSMDHKDRDASGLTSELSRLQQVERALREQPAIGELRAKHDVLVLRFFDDKLQTVTELPQFEDGQTAATAAAGTADEGSSTTEGDDGTQSFDAEDWLARLAPDDEQALVGETRIGEALRRAISDYRAGILSGVVMLTDGQSNVGTDPLNIVELAKEADVPVYPIGVGSDEKPINARISGLDAPTKAFIGDKFAIEGYLTVSGDNLIGQSLQVELIARAIDATGQEGAANSLGFKDVRIVGEGDTPPVRFEMDALQEGRFAYELKIANPPTGDFNERDNSRRTEVQIAKQKTRVLLFAGGPNRDYQFLRVLLSREARGENAGLMVDVVLQSAQEGVDQGANVRVLSNFPTTAAQLADYDAIVAFDPDWLELTVDQMKILEDWVYDQAGGLVVVAGPVHTERWTNSEQAQIIQSLYPVEFERRFALLDAGRFKNTEPRQVMLSDRGRDSSFLWLEDQRELSWRAWETFDGVFGFYQVRGPKPAATVYARCQEPGVTDMQSQPIYLAGQLYGVGRVFYLGSGEIWRLRKYDADYFDRFYLKLIRYVSSERGRAGDKRGVLLVDQSEYPVGSPVRVKAMLKTPSQQPLEAAGVGLDLLEPNNNPQRLELKPSQTDRAGTFTGQFLPRQEGTYRLELQVPGLSGEEPLRRVIQVTSPNLEMENLYRNDAALEPLATRTGGKYFIGPEKINEIVDLLPAESVTETQLLQPEPLWDEAWVLAAIVGLLGTEWLIRRMARLA